MKKILLLLGVIAVFILNCGNEGKQQENEKKESKKKFKIGITQIVTHPALDSARQGFKDVIKEAGLEVLYDEKNANGEITTANLIASNFVNSKEDLIYSIATTTTQSVSQAT